MAQSSGFFNAIKVGTVYDRKYNANDYSDNLAVVISNGVLRSTANDLLVSASGMVISVAAGRAWIKGRWYVNDATYSFSAITAPVSGARYDRVVLRFDKTVSTRSITLVYLTGTAAATPTKPAYTRTDDVYDLVLADIYIAAGATSVTVTDTRSDTTLCGWVYSTSGDNSFFTSLDTAFNTWFANAKDTLSSVSLFKRYSQEITLATASTTVTFSISQYDANTCFLEVYVNGNLVTNYTVSGSVLTFTASLVAGSVVDINCYKSIDGTGITTISGEITTLQNQVAAMQGRDKYTFVCSGTNDNVALSEIAKWIYTGTYPTNTQAVAFATSLGGATWRTNLNANAQVTIDVVGRCGVTAANSGTGVSGDYYGWFDIGSTIGSSIRVTFDFTRCEIISVSCAASTYNAIFNGVDLYIRNARVRAVASGASCTIQMIYGTTNGQIIVDDSDFKIEATTSAIIAKHGTFTNCKCETRCTAGRSSCFYCENSGLIRVMGGYLTSYVASTSYSCAVFETAASALEAVITAYNTNCPVISVTSYSQPKLYIATYGTVLLNGIITNLTGQGTATLVNIIGQNKA